MFVGSEPSTVAKAALVDYHDAIWDTVEVARRWDSTDHVVLALSYSDQQSENRRALMGLSRTADDAWRRVTGSFGRLRETTVADVWITWGGWSGDDDGTPSVIGGWVADPATVVARARDPRTGTALLDGVVNGVALFVDVDNLNHDESLLELLDEDGTILRSGPLYRR